MFQPGRCFGGAATVNFQVHGEMVRRISWMRFVMPSRIPMQKSRWALLYKVIKGDEVIKLKKSYERLETFLRWIVVGIILFIMALPALIYLREYI